MLNLKRIRVKHNSEKLLKIIGGILSIILILFLLKTFLSAPASYQATETVKQFYTYESEAKFADSWQMFHPFMQKKFSKTHYIQDRTHVFLNHFGVDTFTFSIGKTKKIKDWSFSESAPSFAIVYRTPVTQYYAGKYGKFSLTQPVYTTKEDGHWTVLWEYDD